MSEDEKPVVSDERLKELGVTRIEGEAPEFEPVEIDDPDKLTFFKIKESPKP